MYPNFNLHMLADMYAISQKRKWRATQQCDISPPIFMQSNYVRIISSQVSISAGQKTHRTLQNEVQNLQNELCNGDTNLKLRFGPSVYSF